jgi:hypothetical protein
MPPQLGWRHGLYWVRPLQLLRLLGALLRLLIMLEPWLMSLKLPKLLILRTGMMRPTLSTERQIATVSMGMGFGFVVGATASAASWSFSLGVLVDGCVDGVIEVVKVSAFKIFPRCFFRRI